MNALNKIGNILLKGLAIVLGTVSALGIIGLTVDWSASSMPALIMAILQGLAALYFWKRSKRGENTNIEIEESAALLTTEAREFFALINAEQEFPPAGSRKLIGAKAKSALLSCDADLHELKSTTSNKTRILKLKKTESGELNITNSQLIFIGENRTLTISSKSINSIDTYNNGFTIHASGRARPLTFVVANGILCSALVRNITEGKIEDTRVKPGYELSVD